MNLSHGMKAGDKLLDIGIPSLIHSIRRQGNNMRIDLHDNLLRIVLSKPRVLFLFVVVVVTRMIVTKSIKMRMTGYLM